MPAADALRDRLLRRIGLDGPPAPDDAGLRAVHRAFVSSIPYEDLSVQLGESGPLDPEALCERMLSGGRGGYCFEINTVLLTLLESLGFEVERRQAVVGSREAHADGQPTNHMGLVARTAAGNQWLVEAGWGEGPLDPIPLAPGVTTVGAFSWELERDGDGWWISQHRYGSTDGFRFADAPSSLAEFAPHHERLSTSPESDFVRVLVVEKPHDDRIETLRSRTVLIRGPGIEERELVPDSAVFAAVLSDRFGIDAEALGPERLGRLWRQVVAQHREHLERRAASAGAEE